MSSKSENKPETWNDVIRNFIKEREEAKIIDLLSKKDSKKRPDDEKQAINIQLEETLKNHDQVKNEDIDKIVNAKNIGKNKIKKFEFVLSQYNELINLKSELEPLKIISGRYEERRKSIEDEHIPAVWLDKYAKYANGVSFATHVAKLTHSSIKGASSFLLNQMHQVATLTYQRPI